MNLTNNGKISWTYFSSIAAAIVLLLSCYGVPESVGASSVPIESSVLTATIVSPSADTTTSANTSQASGTFTPSYPALTLTSPEPGANITGMTTFLWRWDGTLQEGEKFDLRIWRSEKQCSCIAICNRLNFRLDSPPDGFGRYSWQVAVIRIDKNGGRSVLIESEVREFTWTSSPPTPTPEAEVIWKGGLNLRCGPGIEYYRTGYLREGEKLEIQGRTAGKDWILINSIDSPGKFGWTSARSQYVRIINLNNFPVSTLASPPTLIEPVNNIKVSVPNRLGLGWTWSSPLKPDEYFQVEIWNRYNDFITPIDVAWVTATRYAYEQIKLAYHPEYRWRITVIRGTPAGEKPWSTPENRVWEPSDDFIVISEESETWTLIVNPPDVADSPPPAPAPPVNNDDDDDHGGGGSVHGG